MTAQDDGLPSGTWETIEAFRVRYENTGNPLFVWKAINLCFAVAAMRRRAETGQLPTLPQEEMHPLPAWCVAYLSVTAARMACLADGQDFRLAAPPIGAADPADPAAFARLQNSWGSIEGDRAATLATHALGFRNAGANAFKGYQSLHQKELDMVSYLQFTEIDGMSSDEAIEQIAKQRNVEPREVRKRLQRVRQAEGANPD